MSKNVVCMISDDMNKIAEAVCSQVVNGELEAFEHDTLDLNWVVDCVNDKGFTLKNKRDSLISVEIEEATKSFIYAGIEVKTVGHRFGRVYNSIVIEKENYNVLDEHVVMCLDMIRVAEEGTCEVNLIKNDGICDIDEVIRCFESMKNQAEMYLRVVPGFGVVGMNELKDIERFKPRSEKIICIPDGLLEKEVSSKFEYIRRLYIAWEGLSGVTDYSITELDPVIEVVWYKMKGRVRKLFNEYNEFEMYSMIGKLDGVYDKDFLSMLYVMAE